MLSIRSTSSCTQHKNEQHRSSVSSLGMSNPIVHTSLIRCRSYYFLWRSFLCGYYLMAAFISLESLQTPKTAGQGMYEQYSYDCQMLPVVNATCQSWKPVVQHKQPQLQLDDRHLKLFAYMYTCVCAMYMYSSHDYYSRAAFSFFRGGVYSSIRLCVHESIIC